jgi:hypothetical protein
MLSVSRYQAESQFSLRFRSERVEGNCDSSKSQRNLRVPELLIRAIGTFTLSVARYLLTGLLPQVSAELHVSASAVGQLAALRQIMPDAIADHPVCKFP